MTNKHPAARFRQPFGYFSHLPRQWHPKFIMSWALQKTVVAVLFAAMLLESARGKFEQWCVADPQTPDEDLLAALDWACRQGGMDCSTIQAGQPCFLPNTLKDHASFAFNRYYQKFKHRGGSCYFRSAAMITELDPSHGSCHYEYYA
ncbi:hypothetical protein MLD38_015748 [Melastoma candidum]|uniref:Uncharacterized protein n=1 Tax=Melastoma candidum TaxID=119954 RepID=A0ACB9RGF0_9MYRT|nr:hypothetical protein MLD38_015748 [Melastoma candidum]